MEPTFINKFTLGLVMVMNKLQILFIQIFVEGFTIKMLNATYVHGMLSVRNGKN
jgi:hypothetical protein